jgi:hypothetical protein
MTWKQDAMVSTAVMGELISTGMLLWDRITLPTGQQVSFKDTFKPVYDEHLVIVAWSFWTPGCLYWIFNDQTLWMSYERHDT